MPVPGAIWANIQNLYRNWNLWDWIPSVFLRDGWEPLQRQAQGQPPPPSKTDESIGDFISRRASKELADNIASAFFHGVYAGDIYELSVHSLVPELPYLESRYGGCLVGLATIRANKRRIVRKNTWNLLQDRQINLSYDMKRKMQRCSVFTLLNGVEQLVRHLGDALLKSENVTVKLSSPVHRIQQTSDTTTQVRSIALLNGEDQELAKHDTVISTIPYNALNEMISNADWKPQGFVQPSVDVMVVNLYFSDPKLLDANPGFGYLIPRSIPYDQNPECALGVVFDSYAAPGQDTANGTKVTVMLGGHWWKSFNELPTEQEGVWMARSILARHLGITDEPAATQAKLQRQCIPQYVVGHRAAMSNFHQRLLRQFDGRLRVAGCSYNGVGVNDCIRGAYEISKEVRQKGWIGSVTGLENHLHENPILELATVSKTSVVFKT